ncbi:lysis protein [Serratia sp. JSRIV006]|uniref:lysis protein n=1 Tax=Serratia sp. JSRIV006 TaxID=2831896 RepID=UPI001FD99F0B|nr:lysis protein [Serratia sp. JSRIV006]UAN64286.1 lysis protein [Serratia sp. JSRIV006]
MTLFTRYGLVGVLIVAICLGWYASSLSDDLKATQKDNKELSQSLRIQSDLQIRASAIDTHRTRELADAKSKIADLQRDVANGAKRLQLNASCKSASATTTGGVVDGTSARLTDSAERDYFTLRERIETARIQIAGLQDYIHNVCLSK